jgi:3-hydroxyisobutyrate dehydrogenase-like beta-hydroxyacid dehydrogenase
VANIGFLGLGIMGEPMAANLLQGGHQLTVWNRSPVKCDRLVGLGAVRADSPAAVAAACDFTFAMLSDPVAAAAVVFGADGVLQGLGPGHDYIDMSTVDEATSVRIGQAVAGAGARFLEAPVSGTRKPAEDGTLIILAAGDADLHAEAGPLLALMGKMTVYLGELGHGARMKLVVNAIMGGMMSSFGEGLALAARGGLPADDLLAVLDAGALGNPMFRIKGPLMLAGEFSPAFPLKHMQKDLRLALALGDILGQETPSLAAANGAFADALAAGAGDEDFCAVYRTIRKSGDQ